MTVPLTPQLLGYLIDKGYTYVISLTIEHPEDGTVSVHLLPVKEKPSLENLPEGYQTYFKITHEPMQMACGIDNITTVVIELPDNDDDSESPVSAEDIVEDSHFILSEDFYKQVVESLEDYAVFTTDKDGDVSSWNKGAERLLGYTENEIIRTNVAIFFTEEDRLTKQPEKEREIALKEGRAIDERFHVRKDTSVFWANGLVFPLYDTHGVHRGFTKIMRNMEERLQAGRAARQNFS